MKGNDNTACYKNREIMYISLNENLSEEMAVPVL